MSQPQLRAAVVCVEYSDLLAVTLPWNIHHLKEVWVISSYQDEATRELVKDFNISGMNVRTFATNAFYRNGAAFNKWLALEEGLDAMGRHGWMCLLDADVLWPHHAPMNLEPGYLYSPLRRMMPLEVPPRYWPHETTTPQNEKYHTHEPVCFPPEKDWWQYPIHRNVNEWAGYTQIFHADDPHLGKAPWHQTNWIHAGGADSFFQQKWPPLRKRRFSWEVLHLGEAGQNWMGRSTPFLGGETHPDAASRQASMRQLWKRRAGLRGPSRHDHEKLA